MLRPVAWIGIDFQASGIAAENKLLLSAASPASLM
jgi:hypothetical protein